MADLCDVVSLEDSSCCAPTPADEAVVISNPPGLSAIRYRLGSFATFRRSMLAVVPKRLPEWRDLGQRDYGVALLEMWATLADILTFYQERIANEAYLGTALLRESIVRLAALVDYRPNPGAAANAYLAFTTDKDKTVEIAAGYRAQTKPAPGAAPVPFETDEGLTAYASLNALRLRSLQPQSLKLGDTDAILQGVKTNLKVGDFILFIGEERMQHHGSEQWDLRRLTQVLPDPVAGTTRVVWQPGLGHNQPFSQPSATPRAYALRETAWPFGSNAPDYRSLVSKITQTVGSTTSVTTISPNFPDWTGNHLPEVANHPEQIFLDTLYPTILVDSWVALITSESVLDSHKVVLPGYVEVYQVLKTDATVHTNYTLSSKVTRLTVDTLPAAGGKPASPENIDLFPMQGTRVLAQSEELPMAQVPVTQTVAGDSLTLDAVYPDLKPGRLLLVTGNPPGSATPQTETARVKEINGTSVILEADLQYSYDPTSVVIFGNVAPASQGETIADEVLGSGDAAQLFQSFTLKKSPLTFTHATSLDANRWGTLAALQVRVGGVLWQERENLLGSSPAERVYTLAVSYDDKATITFGSGVADSSAGDPPILGGARLPSAKDNVHARYRKGLGIQGNVKAHTITTPLSSAPGLKSVSNPLPGTTGADREDEAAIKTNVPAAMRAFDRAISLGDYAALARTYTGVAKARAFWQVHDPLDPTGLRRLEQPRILLTVASTDHNPPLQLLFKQDLRAFLDARRDPNQPLAIADFVPLSIDLDVTIEPDPALLPETVLSNVAAALSAALNPDGSLGFFDFDRLDFGQSLHLSEMYAVIQAIPGVNAVLITRFRHHARPGELVANIPVIEPHIFINNTEIVRCDNDPADPARGLLALTIGEVSDHAA